MANELDTPLNCRVPAWMAEGLAAVAQKHRVGHTSVVTRWALADYLLREGIAEPETDAAPAA